MFGNDKFPGFGHLYSNICRNARIQMISKKNRFPAEKAINYFPSPEKRNKVLICEMLESSGVFSSPMLPIFSWELETIAYRSSFTIPSSSKLELICGSEIRLWFVFFLRETLPKILKFNQVDIYIFKVK